MAKNEEAKEEAGGGLILLSKLCCPGLSGSGCAESVVAPASA